MRQHPVHHAFDRLRATLPGWRMHLDALVDTLDASGVPLPCVTVLFSTVWQPGHGVFTSIETTLPDIHHLSAHKRLPVAGAQADVDGWVAATVPHLEALMLGIVAKDPGKPALRLQFSAEADRAALVPLRLCLQEMTDSPAQPPNRFHELSARNAPRLLRALRLAAMAKGVGTGPRWSLSVDGNRSQYRVQAPNARVALAWMVGTQNHELPEWADKGRVLHLSVDHIPATPLLRRWAIIQPPLAPTPTLEDHLGF
jgi:hypothetical protein